MTELKITDDVVGTGKEAQGSSTVTAQYVGAVASTGEVFQSSWKMGGAIDIETQPGHGTKFVIRLG